MDKTHTPEDCSQWARELTKAKLDRWLRKWTKISSSALYWPFEFK